MSAEEFFALQQYVEELLVARDHAESPAEWQNITDQVEELRQAAAL